MVSTHGDFMRQASSRTRSPSVAHFGTGDREKSAKVFVPGLMEAGQESPGPVYAALPCPAPTHTRSLAYTQLAHTHAMPCPRTPHTRCGEKRVR